MEREEGRRKGTGRRGGIVHESTGLVHGSTEEKDRGSLLGSLRIFRQILSLLLNLKLLRAPQESTSYDLLLVRAFCQG